MKRIFRFAAAAALLLTLTACGAEPEEVPETAPTFPPAEDVALLDAYDALIAGELEAVVQSIKPPVFTIEEDALAAPKPDPERFGHAKNGAELQWLLDEAAELLDGQETLFSTDTPVYQQGRVDYYLDRSILAITWEQVIDNFVYTISEVKIAHPSQFRRYLPEGEYGSDKLNILTQMSRTTNAVVASAGDNYLGRKHGITVFQGNARRFNAASSVDTCFVDRNGDLVMMPAGSFASKKEVQQFVDEHNISFSFAFGPILVEDGKLCDLGYYPLGEVKGNFPRAAICQMGQLHYLAVVANGDGGHWDYVTIKEFAENIAEFGCQKAYALDGGQTATIVMNNKLINHVQFGRQRLLSDMFYFATAIPEE